MELKIAKRYAQALFELARDGDILPATRDDLSALAELFRIHSELKGFIGSHLVASEARGNLLEVLLARLQTGDLVQRFVKLLLARNRLILLPGIEECFIDLAREHLGIVAAEVETAQEMSDETRERLVQALSRFTGKTIELSEKVRPELIAGIRIQIGSLLMDGTLERQLAQLRQTLLEK